MSCLFAWSVALTALLQPPVPSGVLRGHVEVGPIRPVEIPEKKVKTPPAFYRPYTILVVRGAFKRELKLGDDGGFSANLAPGRYLVSVKTKVRLMHPPESKKVDIEAGKTTTIRFVIDTGIR